MLKGWLEVEPWHSPLALSKTPTSAIYNEAWHAPLASQRQGGWLMHHWLLLHWLLSHWLPCHSLLHTKQGVTVGIEDKKGGGTDGKGRGWH